MKLQTRLIHQSSVELPGGNKPLVPPIYQNVKFTANSMAELNRIFASENSRFVYSRISNPNTDLLEKQCAQMQGTEAGVSFASGVAAISVAMLSLLKQGDHIIIFIESYKPTRFLAQELMHKYGVQTHLLSIHNTEIIESTFSKHPIRLVLFESPTNPMTFVAPIDTICQLAAKNKSLVALDNTFAGLHQHHHFKIDLYIHSLTKYANGHGDAMGGVILGSHELIQKIRHYSAEIGACMDPHSAFLISRGLKTYYMRYKNQSESAQQIAIWLENRAEIDKVYYPGLTSHPQHPLATQQMNEFGAVLSIDLASKISLNRFIDSLRLFTLCGSLGSIESLVAPSYLFYGKDLNSKDLATSRITPQTVRLAVGLESPTDLITDLEQAMTRASI